jgi:carbonic anhydrase
LNCDDTGSWTLGYGIGYWDIGRHGSGIHGGVEELRGGNSTDMQYWGGSGSGRSCSMSPSPLALSLSLSLVRSLSPLMRSVGLLSSLIAVSRVSALLSSRPIVSRFLSQTSKFGVDPNYFNRAGPWDEKDLPSLLEANKRWANRIQIQNPGFFDDIKKGHAPKILWIGCSDARVPANEIIGEPPGSVFVHRNIANQVISTDFNCMSVIQYAVDVLKVKHIIVCGHYDCGGVRAATELRDHSSPLENWLRHIRDIYRIHKNELDSITDSNQRRRRLVELNVVEQVEYLLLFHHLLAFNVYIFL